MDKLLGKDTGEEPPPPEASNLEDTSFHADGEGVPTENGETERTWYGKKKEKRNGVKTGKKDRQKHRRFARLKKLLNVGEKLTPVGLGGTGADYDGQTPAREQGKDDASTPQTNYVDQSANSSGNQNVEENAGAGNMDYANRNYDLYVHVFEARGLQALDSNGLSDPYCKIHLGSKKQRTKTISDCLEPQWEETFHFTSDELRKCLMKSRRLAFELRDSDFLSPDEFLGSVVLDLNKIALTPELAVGWYMLQGKKHGEIIGGLGEIRIGLMLSNTDEEQEDSADNVLWRMRSEGERDGTCLSTLCTPRGKFKLLPTIVHTEGNCLYEEPCIYYLSLQVGEVRRISDFEGLGDAERRNSMQWPETTGSSYTEKLAKPSASFFNTSKTSWDMFMSEMEDSTAWQASDDESDEEESEEDDSDDDAGPKNADEGEDDPFDDEDEGNLENPLQAPDVEEEQGQASQAPLQDKRLYVEASLGNQRRRSRLTRFRDKKFSWNQGLPFAATVPVKDKKVKVILCERDSSSQETCPIAVAFVSVLHLLKEKAEEGKWYKLHEYGGSNSAKPRVFGAVRLKLRGSDSDGRITLYHQPLFREGNGSPTIPAAVQIDPREHSHTNGSAENSAHSKDWKVGAEKGYEEDYSKDQSLDKGKPNIVKILDERLAQFHQREVYVTAKSGISRWWQEAQRFGLLFVQALLALMTVSLQLGFFFWEKHGHKVVDLVRNCFPSGKIKREREEPDNDTQLKPADLALGVMKVVLKDLDLHDQPRGKYFCVFKCGPHWGQTPGIRTSDKMKLNWEVHLPIIEPHTLFTLVLFRDMHRKETSNFRSRPPQMIGKLRLRLNTLQTEDLYNASLPMLGDRKEGGHHNATADLEIKTAYFFEKPVVQKYFEADRPYDVYALNLGEGNVAKQLDFEYRRLCFEWLEHADPRIPRSVAKAVIGLDRQQFVFSRAKANWARFMMEKERFTWIIRFWKRNQAWENPLETVCLMCSLVTFSFYPQVILVGLILLLAFYSFLAARKRPDKPWKMIMDPDEDDDDEDDGEGGITKLRQKYFRLVKVALSVQNYLEDFADTMERLHAFINWADPKATLVFIFACLAVSLAIMAFSLPVVLSIGLCWTVRPPVLRSPTPPAPLSFFLRLPTRSDQII